MNNIDLIAHLPTMLLGDRLYDKLADIPKYDDNIRTKSQTERLIYLSTLYDVYLPSNMSTEIYSKLYLSLVRSLQKKFTKIAVQQSYQNHYQMDRKESRGIIGGSDSFSIIGCSGIGKSSAITRAISVITENQMIEDKSLGIKIIPCLIVQCPFDASVKSMLLEILRKADELLGTTYYMRASRLKTTTDSIIGSVSQVALQHIGLLIIDEIQNCVGSKNGRGLVAMLTQLINSSGISICLVGTPETLKLFEAAFQLARRSLGLQYHALPKDKYFDDFCKLLFKYQYVKEYTDITPQMIDWLYDHSGGITSVVVSLIHDAQELAILNGYEKIGMSVLNQTYENRMQLLHGYIKKSEPIIKNPVVKQSDITPIPIQENEAVEMEFSIVELLNRSKEQDVDLIRLLKKNCTIEEIHL